MVIADEVTVPVYPEIPSVLAAPVQELSGIETAVEFKKVCESPPITSYEPEAIAE